jgi:hypothetical protein
MEMTISTTPLDETSEPARAKDFRNLKPISSQPTAGHPDPLSETLRDEKSEPARAKDFRDLRPISSQPTVGHPDPLAELERLIGAKR